MFAMTFCALSFLLGVNWGLPTRAYDRFLFGDRTPWTGQQIVDLLGVDRGGAGLGADVDRDPVVKSGKPVVLNDTDARRAEIVRRYRLYSAQPDEMITFMALSGMRPREMKLDPKLYQYGGLWIYPVGGTLAAGSALGLVDLKTDPTYYLDRPEAFGRFYVAARLYSAALGLVGCAALWWLMGRLTGSAAASTLTAVCYALLPVVNTMAHEAKPHLPAAALMLLAVVAATKFVETGRRRWWIGTGAVCGAATGMILSAWPVIFVLPAMMLLRRGARTQRWVILLAAGLIAVDVYLLTNPYVMKHAVSWNSADNPLKSNLANSRAMYRVEPSLQGAVNAGRLLGDAATPVVAIAGGVGMLVLCLTLGRRTLVRQAPLEDPAAAVDTPEHRRAVAVMLSAPAVVIFVQFLLLAGGKPGEYARFALYPAIVLLAFSIGLLYRLAAHKRVMAGLAVAVLIVPYVSAAGVSYVWHFINDGLPRSSRIKMAERLADAKEWGADRILVSAEPAPYNLPPVDLFRRTLVLSPDVPPRPGAGEISLVPVDSTPEDEALVQSVEGQLLQGTVWIRPRLLETPISWAGKSFTVWRPMSGRAYSPDWIRQMTARMPGGAATRPATQKR